MSTKKPGLKRNVRAAFYSPDPDYEDVVRAAIRKFGKPVGQGLTRMVFANADRTEVIKIPTRTEGETANERELIRDNWLGDPERYARAFPDEALSKIFGVFVIRMEWVTPAPNPYELADWVGAVDCGQVGYTADGRLVAYDWGG